VNPDSRRTDLVHRTFDELVTTGRYPHGLRPADVSARLREHGLPLGIWEIRYELTQLERAGVVVLDADSGRWQPNAAARSGKRRNTA
jgi:hypothetical protein